MHKFSAPAARSPPAVAPRQSPQQACGFGDSSWDGKTEVYHRHIHSTNAVCVFTLFQWIFIVFHSGLVLIAVHFIDPYRVPKRESSRVFVEIAYSVSFLVVLLFRSPCDAIASFLYE